MICHLAINSHLDGFEFFSKYLYPRCDLADESATNDTDIAADDKHDGKYELFADIDRTVQEEFKDLVLNGIYSSIIGVEMFLQGPLDFVHLLP
jgi:hypothetical protein